MDSNQILQNSKDQQICFVGGATSIAYIHLNVTVIDISHTFN